MGLIEDLRALSEQLKKRQPHVRGEEATKQALVIPFLQALGYDVYDPTEVQPEFVSDFVKRRQGGPLEKVDYAIRIDGEPAIFVECKAVDVALDAHDGQLSRYFNATPTVRTAILTNGTRYRFFTDLQTPNVMDSTPFFEFDVFNFTDRDVETLKGFTRPAYNGAVVKEQAEELIFTGKVTGLVQELLRSPSEPFVRFLLDQASLVQGRVTARVVERFTPIVQRAIQTTLVELMTKSIQQEMVFPKQESAAPAPATAPVPEPPSLVAAAIAEGKVVTTDEELQVFDVVKRLCAESALGRAIAYKDTVSYFGINIGGVRSWFLRFYARDDRKYAVLRLPLERASVLAPGFKIEPAPEYSGGSRVFVKDASDFEKLRALVLTAYEDAVKRKDTGGEEDEGGAPA